ncbi:MAG: alpha/beta hydrolase [Kineosporiaceae bacterium]|nr:alpha/beta hydrolase [Aeromicrobium sp.]
MMWARFRKRFGGLSSLGYRASERTRLLLPRRKAPMRGVYQQAVLHDTYSIRARVVQRAVRLFMQPVLRYAPITPATIRAVRALDRTSAKAPRSRYVEPIGYQLGGIRVESMTHRLGPTSDMTILYFHGGAFMSGSIDTHRRICERLARLTGANVISVDYVQLPEGAVADSVQDAMRAYEGLLAMCLEPGKIVVAGDSAGGYLTMKVAELATRRGLQAPAALLCFSPLLSLDPERQDKAVERIHPVNDAYLPPKRLPKIRALWNPEGSTIEGFASPFHASAYIDSPLFMTAVEDEMLRPEVEAMSLLLANRDVQVETHIWRKQVHAFPVLADILPESRHALRLAADFARIAVGELERAVPEELSGFEPVEERLIADEVWLDESLAESFVDGETLVGEIEPWEPSAEEEILDGEFKVEGRRWFHRAP